MNNATVKGMRNLWSEVTRNPTTMTALEMATISHNLSKDGDTATCKDGRVFVWSNDRKVWVKVK